MAAVERPDLAIIDRNLSQGASGVELPEVAAPALVNCTAIIVTGSTDPEGP